MCEGFRFVFFLFGHSFLMMHFELGIKPVASALEQISCVDLLEMKMPRSLVIIRLLNTTTQMSIFDIKRLQVKFGYLNRSEVNRVQ